MQTNPGRAYKYKRKYQSKARHRGSSIGPFPIPSSRSYNNTN